VGARGSGKSTLLNLISGIDRLDEGQESDNSLIVFQIYRFCPETSRLPGDYASAIAKIPGVVDVLPMKVFMNNCGATLDLIVFHGVPPKKLRSFRQITLLEGDWDAFELKRDAALIGQQAARQRGLKVGDTYTLGEVTVHIVGIFASTVPVEERLIYCRLEFLQYTRGLNSVGMVTQFEVKLSDQADPEVVARAARAEIVASLQDA